MSNAKQCDICAGIYFVNMSNMSIDGNCNDISTTKIKSSLDDICENCSVKIQTVIFQLIGINKNKVIQGR